MTLQGAEGADGIGQPKQLATRLNIAGPLAAHAAERRHQLEDVGHPVPHLGDGAVIGVFVTHATRGPTRLTITASKNASVGPCCCSADRLRKKSGGAHV